MLCRLLLSSEQQLTRRDRSCAVLMSILRALHWFKCLIAWSHIKMHSGIKDIQVFLTHTNMNLPAHPRPCHPPPLAACRLLAINAHFTYSSTPLALICVALNILHAGSNSTLLFHPVWSTDGLHGPKREDLVFQVFSSGSRGDQGRILGRARPLAACSQKD